MSLADDLAAAVQVWDLTGDLTVFAQALGGMAAEVEQYVLDREIVVATTSGVIAPGNPVNAISTLPTTPDPYQLSPGKVITLSDPTGTKQQDWVVAALAPLGSTSIQVEPDVPNATYPAGSTLSMQVESWQALWDVDVAPTEALPWLAQVVGERIPPGSTDAQMRALINANPNSMRGTLLGVANAVKQVLTGGKRVGIWERHHTDGTPDDNTLAVITFSGDTPNANAVLAALRRTVPADINVEYQIASETLWSQVEQGMSSWTQLENTYGPTWATVATAEAGYVIF